MKVDGSLDGLIQGVSQQPRKNRLKGQCTKQENMTSNPVDGLSRRPPTDFLAELFESENDIQFYQLTNNYGDFVVCAELNNLRVFSIDGEEKTVNEVDDAFDYLDGGKLCFTTLEDVTYVGNKSTTVLMEDELPTFVDYGSIIYIKGGTYSTDYTITVNWKDAGPMGTPREISVTQTTSASSAANIKTPTIATNLKALLDAATTNSFNTTFDVFRDEDTLYIQWKPATLRTDVFSVTVTESSGNNNIIAINNSVKRVADLPRFAPHGYYVVVTGDGSQQEDDYYLEFSVNPDDQGVQPALGSGYGSEGLWIETVKKNIKYLLDWETMPHVLEYDPEEDEFNFSLGEWKDRTVGDEESNPTPSFVDRKINDLSYFQGRLVILAGPAVIMSRTDKHLEFFVESAVVNADTDPIDVQSTSEGITSMVHAIPHNRDLVIFAEKKAQFIVFGRNTLTPDNASLVLTTAFEANLNAKPVPSGRNVFFAINYGNFTGIREFYTEGAADINDSRPVTQHVLKYISGLVKHMSTSSNFDTLLVQAGDLNKLYIYEYIWVGDRKAQSSWSTWTFPEDVVFFFFIESVIYLVSKIEDTYAMYKIDLNAQFNDGLTYQVKLDKRVVHENVSYDIVNPVPYETDPDNMVFVQGIGCPYPGMRVMAESYDAGTDTITLEDDMDGGDVIAGVRYTSSYIPTMPLIKDQSGTKIGTGKLRLSRLFPNLEMTGQIAVNILYKYRNAVQMYFGARTIGSPDSLIGQEAVTTRTESIPFRENADYGEIEIWTDSHTPMTILDIEWKGQYTKRGQRVPQGE